MTFNASITMIETFAVVADSLHVLLCFALLFGFLFIFLSLNSLVQFSAWLQNHFVVFGASAHLFEVLTIFRRKKKKEYVCL